MSRKPIGAAALALALAALLAPASAQTDKKAKPKGPFFKIGVVAGKVTDVDEAGKMFKLRVRGADADIEVTVDSRTKIRVPPRDEFDDKGNPKPFRPDKKDPDWRLGGVKGSLKDLEKDATVTARLLRSGTRKKPGDVYLAEVVVRAKE